MGLDMYLFRTRRVPGFTASNYERVNAAVYRAGAEGVDTLDLESATGLPGANALRECIHIEGQAFPRATIFAQAAYWRKANAVHQWFVHTVQEGEDDCRLSDPVNADALHALRVRAQLIWLAHADTEGLPCRVLPPIITHQHTQRVLDDGAPMTERLLAARALETQESGTVARILLPPQPGFFFGSTALDRWYYSDLVGTIKQLNTVMSTTDWDREVVFYHSSW
jgi:hypothetical protein